MKLTRRSFLMSGAAVVAGAALPKMPGPALDNIAVDLAKGPSSTLFVVTTPTGISDLWERMFNAEFVRSTAERVARGEFVLWNGFEFTEQDEDVSHDHP